MRKFLDEIENAAAKLQDFGKKVVQNAGERFEEIKPDLQQGIGKAVDTAKDAYDKARPNLEDGIDKAVQSGKEICSKADSFFDKAEEGLDRVVEEAKNAYERAVGNLFGNRDSDEKPVPGEDIPVEAPAKPVSVEEEINLDVEEQLEKIRAAQNTPGAFSDYIAKKFGKDKQ